MIKTFNLTDTFFKELKQYNSTNFKTLHTSDLTTPTADILKAYSSVITRYFIFCEKHPELSESDRCMLYYKLRIDMIARFFSNYPDMLMEDLVAFQTELRHYLKECEDDNDDTTSEV